MTKSKQIDNNEINLIDLIITIIEGKWKIFSSIIITLLVLFAQQAIFGNKVKNFTASTEIFPINSYEESKYLNINNSIYSKFFLKDSGYNLDKFNNNTEEKKDQDFNIMNLSDYMYIIPKFTKSNFLNIYIEVLNEKKLFEEAIRKYNLIDINLYDDEKKYNEAVTKLASSIKIVKNFLGNKKKNTYTVTNNIQFTFNDGEKWKDVLRYVDEKANKVVQLNLQSSLENFFFFINQQKKYELEDISTRIDNIIKDYDQDIENKILFLEEQAAIAKALGIENNSIEIQTYVKRALENNSSFPNQPFYLKGYIAIEKEIELIKGREDKNLFITGLYKLKRAKRSIQQDKTSERIQLLFSKTPASNNKDFIAASVNISATTFKYEKNNQRQSLILAILIGFLIGVFYVIIHKALKSKES
jgi:hypothetical protein